jgi:hypothetical protein
VLHCTCVAHLDHTRHSQRERIELRNATERLSTSLDWRQLQRHYLTARSLALERTFGAKLQPSASYENLSTLDLVF